MVKHIRFWGSLFLMLFIVWNSHAQFFEAEPEEQEENQEEELDFKPWYYGGYMSLSFGTYTIVGLTPLVGYKISPRFSVGGQLSYEYVKDKTYEDYGITYEASSLGYSLFSRYRVIPLLYGHMEFSQMNYENYYTDGGSYRDWVSFLWIGGGYSQPVGQNIWFNTQILFDVINNENSPYYGYEPYFSVGFGVGF